MHEPTHIAIFRSGAPGAPFAFEPAYSPALSVPPVGRFLQSRIHVTEDEPWGPPKPDPEIMALKVDPRPNNYADLDRAKKREVDLSLAAMKRAIKAEQKAEVERAKKAAALKKIVDREKDKEKRAAEKDAAKKRKVAEKAHLKALKESKRTSKAHYTSASRETGIPAEFWFPYPPMCAYRRPLASGDGWPMMSRTMTQAIHDFEYEDRLIRTANGQLVGFF
ncbi:hypothetical protein CspHIS471_0407220 [Cutaneotrichosporon sp. HIS471]|nr:hypothetical protein CspHIS471_0407220 [Cutaneotrichosporon sp. HIS471]